MTLKKKESDFFKEKFHAMFLAKLDRIRKRPP